MRKLLFLLALVLAGCMSEHTPQRWRVTVEVETPEGVSVGSGVVETHFRPRNEFLLVLDGAKRWTLGEAIAIDLPQGLVLALLKPGGDYGFYRPQRTSLGWVPDQEGQLRRMQIYPAKTPEEKATARAYDERLKRSREAIKAAITERRSFELLEEGWPDFLFLPDPADPKSVIPMAPMETAQAAAGSVRVRRILVQETDEPVTRTLADRIPWITQDWGDVPICGHRIHRPRMPCELLDVKDLSRLKE